MRRPSRAALGLALAPAVALWGCDDDARPATSRQVCLSGGTFEMGTFALDPCGRMTESEVICRADEASEGAWHAVYLTPYRLDATEVTNGQYADCVAHGPCTRLTRTDAGAQDASTWVRYYTSGTRWREHPVVNVSHEQAQAYCAWRGGRLPTEAEWEMAARGPGGRATEAWAWGDGPDPAAACRDDPESVATGRCADGFPWPVGQAALDRRGGVQDLMGNVSEWVLDAWDPLAFCDEASRAEYAYSGISTVDALPTVRDPAALDARCAGLPDCLAECDAERFWCQAACVACREADAYGACQTDAYCAQACRQPDGCDCDGPADARSTACAEACLCLPTCRGAPFPPAASPDTCLRHCFEAADDRCRERGCLKAGCRTFCGDVLRESNRLCAVRDAGEGAPVEVPVVLDGDLPAGAAALRGNHVVKGGDYLLSEDEACEVRIGRRFPSSDVSPRIGFRCAFDVPPGQRVCPAPETAD